MHTVPSTGGALVVCLARSTGFPIESRGRTATPLTPRPSAAALAGRHEASHHLLPRLGGGGCARRRAWCPHLPVAPRVVGQPHSPGVKTICRCTSEVI